MLKTDSLDPLLKQAFIRLVGDQTGLKIRENDQTIFREIILKRIQIIGISLPENYYQFLEVNTAESREEWKILTSEITNIESFFFRDKGQFKLLRNHIFPDLIQKRATDKTLRICSAGCSTGEEPYSLAILLKELLPDIEDWTVKIIGIDINQMALARATRGIYRSWSFRGVESDIKNRFFQEVQGNYHIDPTIRNMVNFQRANLFKDSILGLRHSIDDMDLIVCRNVFIYFSESAIKAVLEKFYNALSPLGYLLVGHSELYSQNLTKFQVKIFEESITYQRPLHDDIHPKSKNLLFQPIPQLRQRTSIETASQDCENLFQGHDIKMQEAALNLLRQLPANAKIARLGNRTASELILQLEENLKAID